MHNLQAIREHPDAFDAALRRRGLEPKAQELLVWDRQRRAVQTETQEAQAQRNSLSQRIATARKQGDDAAVAALTAQAQALKEQITAGSAREQDVTATLTRLLEVLPNSPLPDVPDGAGEADNVELRRVGSPPRFSFPARQHFDLGEALGAMDFDAAARMSGARFVVLRGALARLERALACFMMDLHTTEHGLLEISSPALVRAPALYGTAQLPKFADDLFQTVDGYWLIPTAEVTLTNLAQDRIWDESDLPKRFVAWTPCFRSEAGAAGRDTRGMIRQHQFSKVEMVSVVHPEQSDAELERMTGCAEEVLRRLQLPYRVVALCAGDMGFSACKTYDIEVWLPGQEMYREISSCSNCGDFQTRRMMARFRPAGSARGTRFLHSLNGSGLAVGRTLVAVLENYQTTDGSIVVPEALRPYMGGLERLSPAGELDLEIH